jgi:hypothetical protein
MGNFNPNYFERKAGSLERAVLDAVNGVKTQINEDSMNVELDNDKMLMRNIEKMGVKIKILNRFGKNPDVQLIGKKDKINKVVDKYQTSMRTDNNFAFNETNKNDKSDDGEGLDAVQPKAVKKKFDDRKDKDIDNDGDTDDSDKFLHKKRKAISKAISKDEGNAFGKALMSAKEKGEKTFVVAGKTYKVKEELAKENFEVGTKERTDHTLNTTPGQSPEDFDQQVGVMQGKNNYMRETLAKMWGYKEGHNPFKDKKEEKKTKVEKTMTGKKATEVKVDPKIEETKK